MTPKVLKIIYISFRLVFVSFSNHKHKKNMDQIYKQSRELFEKKNNDYGDNFMDYITIGILVRLGDKIKRTENLWQKKILILNLLMIVYLIHLIILF